MYFDINISRIELLPVYMRGSCDTLPGQRLSSSKIKQGKSWKELMTRGADVQTEDEQELWRYSPRVRSELIRDERMGLNTVNGTKQNSSQQFPATMTTVYPGQSVYNTSLEEYLIWETNERKAKALIPAMTFIGFLAVIGLFGNILVCYVFTRHIRLSTSTFLLLFLALLDIINCTLAMPFEIADMRFYHVFYSEITCRIFRLIVSFPNINSMFILLIITVDRYKKVCKPMTRQMKLKDARMHVTIATVAALLLSIPAVFIYGLKTVETGIAGLLGKDCSTSDAMRSSLFPFIYQTIGGSLMLIIFATLCYLYGCIWREIRRHAKYVRSNTQLVLMSSSRRENHQKPTPDLQERGSQERINSKYRFASGHRITVIAFIVTLMFMISNAPYAIIMVTRAVLKKPFCLDDDEACFVMYNILIRSYFVSSVINPVVYGFMSKHFRQECLKLGIPNYIRELGCPLSSQH